MSDSNQNIVEFRLTGTLSTSGTSVTVSNDIHRDSAIAVTDASVTLINEQGTVFELVKCTIATGTLTTSKRGLTQAQTLTEDSALKKEWRPGTKGFVTSFASDEFDKETGQLAVYATTTARDATITAPSNGMSVYVTATGTFTDYIAGTWTNRPTAAVSDGVNASETVAGRVEKGTTAQSITPTDTGETGAYTFVSPSDIAKNTQSGTFVYGADTGGDDTYVVALTPTLAAYTAGQTLYFKPTTANTGACSVDFGPGVLNIKTKDGNDPQSGVLRALTEVSGHYDGTNFVIDAEDFATATNKGIVEMLTDAEALTGTDQTRYVNAYQLQRDKRVITLKFSDLVDISGGAPSMGSQGKILSASATTGFWGGFNVPDGVTAISSIIMNVSGSATNAGDIVVNFDNFRRTRAGVVYQDDATTATTTIAVNTTAEYGFTITPSSTYYDGLTLQSGDFVGFRFLRTGADGGDTYTGSIAVNSIVITLA